MNERNSQIIRLFLVVGLLITSLGLSTNVQSQNIWNFDLTLKILQQYADALSGKIPVQDGPWSETISSLLLERRDFYSEYFNLGLHSTLTNLDVEFDRATITKLGKHRIQVIESVTLTGVPLLQVAEDYPIYQATLLASTKMEDAGKAKYLASNAWEILRAVEESILQGEYKFIIINTHTFEFDLRNERIISEEFSSRAIDDKGTDTVVWEEGRNVRIPPDYTNMPDYLMYRSSIEELSRQILDSVANVDPTNSRMGVSNQIQYSGSNAAAYMRTWVRVTGILCNGAYYQDRAAYNPTYEGCPDCYCNDCANYVSQGLTYGGLGTTSTWEPYTDAWRNVSLLEGKILGLGYGNYRSCSTIGLGDLGFIPNQHVVMVTALNPMRYSGHTNDRLNYPWSTQFTRCIDTY